MWMKRTNLRKPEDTFQMMYLNKKWAKQQNTHTHNKWMWSTFKNAIETDENCVREYDEEKGRECESASVESTTNLKAISTHSYQIEINSHLRSKSTESIDILRFFLVRIRFVWKIVQKYAIISFVRSFCEVAHNLFAADVWNCLAFLFSIFRFFAFVFERIEKEKAFLCDLCAWDGFLRCIFFRRILLTHNNFSSINNIHMCDVRCAMCDVRFNPNRRKKVWKIKHCLHGIVRLLSTITQKCMQPKAIHS